MTERIPRDIIQRIFDDNSDILHADSPESKRMLDLLTKLRQDLASNLPLCEIADGGPDQDYWNAQLEFHRGVTVSSSGVGAADWLNSAWLFSEFYFYRRVAEAFDHFGSGVDPFELQKRAGLRDSLPVVASCLAHVFELLPLLGRGTDGERRRVRTDLLQFGIYTSLWGNKMDLSLWPASVDAPGSGAGDNAALGPAAASFSDRAATSAVEDGGVGALEHLQRVLAVNRPFLIDDCSAQALQWLLVPTVETEANVAIIVDNAGYEIVSDLLLAFLVLRCEAAPVVVLHVKAYPTFVSDATASDVIATLEVLSAHAEEAVSLFGREMLEHVAAGRVQVQPNACWCQPVPLYELPPGVQRKLAGAKVVFVKGDANYRRLVGKWVSHGTAARVGVGVLLMEWTADCLP